MHGLWLSVRRRSSLASAWAGLSLLLLGAALVSAPAAIEAQATGGWRQLRRHDGITSWERDRPGQPLSAFRAQTVLDASLWQALAVLDDVDRACEWTSHCATMKRLRVLSEQEVLVYARMAAPWPVHDRDVVVSVRAAYGESGELSLLIEDTKLASSTVPQDVVRMPKFAAHYRFRLLSEDRAEVEYQIEVDPGGILPDWLKRLVARNLAHDTLADLRERVRWTVGRGMYRERSAALARVASKYGFRSGSAAAASAGQDEPARQPRASTSRRASR